MKWRIAGFAHPLDDRHLIRRQTRPITLNKTRQGLAVQRHGVYYRSNFRIPQPFQLVQARVTPSRCLQPNQFTQCRLCNSRGAARELIALLCWR